MTHPPFNFAAPEDSPGFLLWQTTTIWQRRIKKALEQHNLSHAQFVLMALLLWYKKNNFEPMQIDLIQMSRLDKMTVSKSLSKLTKMGLTTRIENIEDTRGKLVSLTEDGILLTSKLVPIVEKIDSMFFGIIDQHEQHSFIKTLIALNSHNH